MGSRDMPRTKSGPRRANAGIRFAGIRRDRQIPAPMTFPDAAPAGLTASSSTATHAHADVSALRTRMLMRQAQEACLV
jgi:hypothetical protein